MHLVSIHHDVCVCRNLKQREREGETERLYDYTSSHLYIYTSIHLYHYLYIYTSSIHVCRNLKERERERESVLIERERERERELERERERMSIHESFRSDSSASQRKGSVSTRGDFEIYISDVIVHPRYTVGFVCTCSFYISLLTVVYIYCV